MWSAMGRLRRTCVSPRPDGLCFASARRPVLRASQNGRRVVVAIVVMALAAATAYGANRDKLPTDTFKAGKGKTLEISFIRHGSLALNYDGKVIYVDPVANFKPMSDYTVDYSTLDKADIILITHAHQDHLDPAVIKTLSKPGTQVICNGQSADTLGYGDVMRNGDTRKEGSWLTLTAVPAHNTTPGREMFHPANGRDNGYVLEFPGLRLYISGDTEVVPDVVCDPKKPVDVAFISMNQPYTMTPQQAADQARKLKPKVLYPYHFGDSDTALLVKLLEGSGIDVRIRQMQ